MGNTTTPDGRNGREEKQKTVKSAVTVRVQSSLFREIRAALEDESMGELWEEGATMVLSRPLQLPEGVSA
jgi:hypothetical protein